MMTISQSISDHYIDQTIEANSYVGHDEKHIDSVYQKLVNTLYESIVL